MAVNISLPPKLEEKIAARVASGEYADPSDVVREALRLFEKYEQIEATHRRLREAVMKGVEELHRGESEPFSEDTVKDIERRGMARLRAHSE